MTPSEVWVCGQRFEIRHKPGLTCKFFEMHGRIEFHTSIIEINVALSEEYQRETLLHEIIHGIDFMLSRGDSDLSEFLEGSKDRPPDGMTKLREPEVVLLSRAMWWTLADPRNAEVTKWIFLEK